MFDPPLADVVNQSAHLVSLCQYVTMNSMIYPDKHRLYMLGRLKWKGNDFLYEFVKVVLSFKQQIWKLLQQQ